MPIEFTFRPLDHSTWIADGRTHYKSCRFRSDHGKTMALLKRELQALDVRTAVIEIDLPESQIRNDGLPYQRANPREPAVRISFQIPGIGPVQYPCNTFDDWRANVRAIALTLEAQRAMDRYGATRHRQQYTGWKQLPPGNPGNPGGNPPGGGPMTPINAAHTIAALVPDPGSITAEAILTDRARFRNAYLRAARDLHPDTNHDPSATRKFQQLQEARRVLDQHHNRSEQP